ncbi:MAG: thioredoxin domain-containing protein [Gemmatimonadales bacterium]|nr:MAG: thioredoxin domain-containing protein [Gemmatimonadales bacterium]
MNKQLLFVGAVGVSLLVFFGATMLFNASQAGGGGAVSDGTLATLDRAHAPSLGEPDAPVVIAEFLDPACETCAIFYPMVKELMAANPGRIRLVLRWAPFHQGATDVVALLEAARMQGQFWPAMERLLGTQSQWAINHRADVNLAWRQLGGLNLDLERIQADMASPEVQQILQQDMADAQTMGVQATPEYFVNGRPMPSFGWEQLVGLVYEELAATR